MITTIEALNILSLPSKSSTSSSSDKEFYQQVENAYQKMIRRYPPEVFPERALLIRKAHDALMFTEEHLREILNLSLNCKNEVDLSFLSPYLHSNEK
ncbi:MAG: hypothetical protein HQK49_21330 [Oligoflexia bacterium]|nr:hypothetical protein [Oligoflexia bacterium]